MSKNNLQIIFCSLSFLGLSLLALFYLPLLSYYSNPSATYSFFKWNLSFYELLVSCLIVATIIYFWLDQKLVKNPPRVSIILSALSILSLILILVFPIGASDIFLYLFQARTFTIHGLNPYINSYIQLTNDAFYPFLKDNVWAGNTSSYGPLFTLITSGLSLVFKSNFLASLLLFKSFFAAIHIANAWLVNKTLGKRFAFLYAFNPLIIFEFLINGHNEVLMIFFCLLSFYFLWKKTPNLKNSLLSIFFLTLGILIKFVPLLLLPIWGLALLWRLDSKNEKKLFIGLSIPLILTTGFLAYLPFWQGLSTLITPITNQMQFTSYLLSSPLIPVIFSVLLSLNVGSAWSVAILTSQGLFLCLLLFITIKIIRKWKAMDVKKLLNYGTIIIIMFCASFFSWLMPWYFTFLLLLLLISHALNNKKRYLIIFYLITIIGSSYYIILR